MPAIRETALQRDAVCVDATENVSKHVLNMVMAIFCVYTVRRVLKNYKNTSSIAKWPHCLLLKPEQKKKSHLTLFQAKLHHVIRRL